MSGIQLPMPSVRLWNAIEASPQALEALSQGKKGTARRIALQTYLTKEVTQQELAPELGVKSLGAVRYQLLQGLGNAFRHLPEDVQKEYVSPKQALRTRSRLNTELTQSDRFAKMKKTIKSKREEKALRFKSGEYSDLLTLNEEEVENHAVWFGSLFEIGGTIIFRTVHIRDINNEYFYAQPYASVEDNDELRIDTMVSRFGGKKDKQRNSWRWTVYGDSAVWFVSTISPYAPSRREAALAMQNWQNATDTQERIQIAKDFKEETRLADVTLAEYLPLLEDARYGAGVVDGRGTMYDEIMGIEDQKHGRPRLSIPSQNKPLLDALVQKFGGFLQTELPDDMLPEQHRRSKRTEKIKNPHYDWNIVGSNLVVFLEYVSPHVILRKEKVGAILSGKPLSKINDTANSVEENNAHI